MKNGLHDLATMVGFEVVNVDDGFTNYEFNQKITGVESVSYIIKVLDTMTPERFQMTFDAIVNVLPRKFKKRIYKLVKHSDLVNDEKCLELVMFEVSQYKEKCDYNKLKEYAELVGINLEDLGYGFTYELSDKEKKAIIAKIEQKVPMELAPALGKIKKIEYKIAFIKQNKRTE